MKVFNNCTCIVYPRDSLSGSFYGELLAFYQSHVQALLRKWTCFRQSSFGPHYFIYIYLSLVYIIYPIIISHGFGLLFSFI